MARSRPYDQRPRRDLTTWDTRTASPAVRTGHRLTQRHRPHHLCPSRADRAYTESFSVAAITWFPITRGWPYTAPSSSACPDQCRRRHLRGDTGPRVVVMVGRPIGRTDHGRSCRSRPGTARSRLHRVRRRTTHHSHQQQRTSQRSRPIHSTPANHSDSVNGPAIPGACRPNPQQRCVCLLTEGRDLVTGVLGDTWGAPRRTESAGIARQAPTNTMRSP